MSNKKSQDIQLPFKWLYKFPKTLLNYKRLWRWTESSEYSNHCKWQNRDNKIKAKNNWILRDRETNRFKFWGKTSENILEINTNMQSTFRMHLKIRLLTVTNVNLRFAWYQRLNKTYIHNGVIHIITETFLKISSICN